jgi:hypothetical protein
MSGGKKCPANYEFPEKARVQNIFAHSIRQECGSRQDWNIPYLPSALLLSQTISRLIVSITIDRSIEATT